MYSCIAFCSLSIPYCVAGEEIPWLNDPQNQIIWSCGGSTSVDCSKKRGGDTISSDRKPEGRKSLLARVSFYFSCFISSDFQGVFECSNCDLEIFIMGINRCWR